MDDNRDKTPSNTFCFIIDHSVLFLLIAVDLIAGNRDRPETLENNGNIFF